MLGLQAFSRTTSQDCQHFMYVYPEELCCFLVVLLFRSGSCPVVDPSGNKLIPSSLSLIYQVILTDIETYRYNARVRINNDLVRNEG